MLKYIIITSFILTIIGFWNRNELAEELNLSYRLKNEPVQTAITKKPFRVLLAKQSYKIQPLYDYELYGLVVSYRHHDGNYGIHRLVNDHLNVSDLCVVWGETAFSHYLNKIKFWNGEFTCYSQSSDIVAWSDHNGNQLSNNHLISADPYIRDQIQSINIGDQIRIQSWLSTLWQ